MTGVGCQQVHEQLESELTITWRRVRRLSLMLARHVDENLEAAAYGLLSALNDVGDVRAGELAERFGVDKSTVSRQLAQMETAGLVERIPDPKDGRARFVHVTEAGKARVAELRQARGHWLQRVLDDWDTEDVDQLVGLLSRLNVALEAREHAAAR